MVKYYEWYENKKMIYVVTKFVEGCTLQNQLEKGRKDYPEREVASIFKQLFKVLDYLEKKKMMHRNIVPNNVMIGDDGHVTLIDFGISKMTLRGKNIDTTKDISQFTAPESYQGEYSIKSDVWSIGNLGYLMFAGKLPFSGDGVMGTFKKSAKRKITFKSSAWSDVSKEAKDLLKEMLMGEPEKRIGPQDLLVHEWFDAIEEENQENEEEQVDERCLAALKDFKFSNKLQKIFVHMLINMLLDDEEFPEMFKKFNTIDKDQDGVISIDELLDAFNSSTTKADKPEVIKIINELDFSDKNQINFTEFLCATLSRSSIKKVDAIKDLFKFFDSDKDNKISEDDILREIQAVDNNLSRMELHQLVEDHATKYKKCLTYEEVEKLVMNIP